MARHEKETRIKRIVRVFIYFLIILFMIITFLLVRQVQEKSKKISPESPATTLLKSDQKRTGDSSPF